MKSVEIKGKQVLIDGVQTQIISGAIHYFRVHPDLWDDRLDKAVAFGLNTIETYSAWNLHEPARGQFNFNGIADIEAFIDKVAARGLKMIFRPGPFICAEWDNGGFPAWVDALPGVQMRCMNKPYLEAVKEYYDQLLPRIKPRLHTNGGPIILISVENEYGSYGQDKEYLRHLCGLYKRHGIDIPFLTCDGPLNHHLLGGAIPEAMITMDFGSDSEAAWENKERFHPNSPDFCMEFWCGDFDHWGRKHRIRGTSEAIAGELEKMLKRGANVNFYMFHGGTNFGFTNGANGERFFEGLSCYLPTTTSYDYGAPLSECGDPTDLFSACQRVIKKYAPSPRVAPIAPTNKVVPQPVKLAESAELFENLKALASVYGSAQKAPTMEELSQNLGFIHYRKRLAGPLHSSRLRLYGVDDYAQVWLDGRYLGSRMRDDGSHPFTIDIGSEGAVLDILVENCGRINYGPHFGRDFKGISHAVTVEFQAQIGWEYASLPLESVAALKYGPFSNEPGKVRFHRGTFTLAETGDSFLRRPGVKGSVWVNGFHLGRYWNIGPTQTLYIPSPVLKQGANEVVVMEQESLDSDTLVFQDYPDLGPLK